MTKCLIVSNRVPYTVRKEDGKISLHHSMGGLATGMESVQKKLQSYWMGWVGIPREQLTQTEQKKLRLELERKHRILPIFLGHEDVELFYEGFCNETIWPLFHCFTQYAKYEDDAWQAYERVNREYADQILKFVGNGDQVWIHDYHLMLVPRMLREQMPDLQIGFFLHIPFPPFDVFHLLPWRDQLVEGIVAADVIGFHTYDYARSFLDSVRRLLGYHHSLGILKVGNRKVKVDAFPMGIDYNRYAKAAISRTRVQQKIKQLKPNLRASKVILSIDRLDYTKGIPQRIEAFDAFLERYPEYRGKVTMVLVAVPSRTRVADYAELKRKVDELLGSINGKYGTMSWLPVHYFYRELGFEELIAYYTQADIALITPIKDGMNLIAKEYVAVRNHDKGVLILSEMAGASRELGYVLSVNPNNQSEIVAAIKTALEMDSKEQRERMEAMQSRLRRYNIFRWADDFLDGMREMRVSQKALESSYLKNKDMRDICHAYRKAEHRLFLLDYDGTLAGFRDVPAEAAPDAALLKLLMSVASIPGAELVIVSGRDRETMDRWFGHLPFALVAEHGVYFKKQSGAWQMDLPMDEGWKDDVLRVLEQFVDRTPMSFIEEKKAGLAWHYRMVPASLAAVRVKQVREHLLHMLSNSALSILDGNNVIEIKPSRINKGAAIERWLADKEYDFILAVGDDTTDEDMFTTLSQIPAAYTFHVGIAPSAARYQLAAIKDVHQLLHTLVDGKICQDMAGTKSGK